LAAASAVEARRAASLVCRATRGSGKEVPVLNWAITFFIIAIVAALFGFSGISGGVADLAQMLFVLFLVLFAISLLVGLRKH
jgi:uncharacterized membrane protein YtjA (UPF0391 family)